MTVFFKQQVEKNAIKAKRLSFKLGVGLMKKIIRKTELPIFSLFWDVMWNMLYTGGFTQDNGIAKGAFDSAPQTDVGELIIDFTMTKSIDIGKVMGVRT